MTRVFISSTYADLREFRSVVYKAIRKIGLDAIAMEDSVSSNEYSLEKCLLDIENSDIYIGIVAWSYGSIPIVGNPHGKSITELEYLKARKIGIPCLIFMLDEEAPWRPTLMDSNTRKGEAGKLIREFRAELVKNHTVTYFSKQEELAGRVAISIQKYLNKNLESLYPVSSSNQPDQLFQQLNNLLRQHNWRKADELTAKIILIISQKKEKGWLGAEDILNIPISELTRISYLWAEHSRNHFGFNIQKDIWFSINSNNSRNKLYPIFADYVGWRDFQGTWLKISAIQFTIDARRGHLPILLGQPSLKVNLPSSSLISGVSSIFSGISGLVEGKDVKTTIKSTVNKLDSVGRDLLESGIKVGELATEMNQNCINRQSILISEKGWECLFQRLHDASV